MDVDEGEVTKIPNNSPTEAEINNFTTKLVEI